MDVVICFVTLHYVLMIIFDFENSTIFIRRYFSYTPQLFAQENGV